MRLSLILFCLLSVAVPGQEMPGPAKELKRLEPLLGTWEGAGTTRMEPDSPEIAWTSRSHARKVLGGHFIREDVLIEIGEPLNAHIAFVTFYGWDADNKRYVSYETSNMGAIRVNEITFAEDGSMLTVSTGKEQGVPYLERWTTRLDNGKVVFDGQRAAGTGPMYTHVKGGAKRVADKSLDVANTPPFMVTVGKEMQRLNRMAGKYVVNGKYAMAPGQDLVPFEGTEDATPIFGGTVLNFIPAGDGYEGWAAMAWDDTKQCFVSVGLNSWGIAHVSEVRFSDDHHLSSMMQGMMMGSPVLSRYILELDDKGHLVKGTSHNLNNMGPPYLSFEATYKPASTGN